MNFCRCKYSVFLPHKEQGPGNFMKFYQNRSDTGQGRQMAWQINHDLAKKIKTPQAEAGRLDILIIVQI